MKARLLKILREADGFAVSQKIMLAQLGCREVELAAVITELNGQGYDIRGVSDGYQLVRSPDTPWPWEFSGRQERIHYLAEVGSTMDVARDLAAAGCPDLTVVVAGIQTRGRGRMDRSWYSDDGGLYFTLVTRPAVSPEEGFQVNFMACAALVRTLRRLAAIPAEGKWPNDILCDGRKLAGMLSEMDAPTGMINYVNIGIGVNLNNCPAERESRAVSLKELTGRRFSRREVLQGFLASFEADYSAGDFGGAVLRWKGCAGSLNREVTVVTRRETVRGTAEDVDRDGALLLRLPDGKRRKVIYGDCFYSGSDKG